MRHPRGPAQLRRTGFGPHRHPAKSDTETHLFAALTSLLNLELRWCCYDLTSTYFETTATDPNGRFASKKFGYSRDHRSDRPQVMIGLVGHR